MVTADDLAWMQGMQNSIQPGTVIIERKTLAPASLGFDETWAVVGTVMGRVYPNNNRTFGEPIMGDQTTSEGRWFATLPVGTSITAKDRLVYANRTFEVVRVNNSESFQTAVRCECVTHNEERRA